MSKDWFREATAHINQGSSQPIVFNLDTNERVINQFRNKLEEKVYLVLIIDLVRGFFLLPTQHNCIQL